MVIRGRANRRKVVRTTGLSNLVGLQMDFTFFYVQFHLAPGTIFEIVFFLIFLIPAIN